MARPDLRLVLVLVALLSGCSIVIGEITPPPCTDDAECEVLNRAPPDGKIITSCRRYQCTGNPASPGTCVYRPTDADDDGQVSAMCPNGTDCDDGNPVIGENLPELCDGLDNDCDLVIDDGDFSGAGPNRLDDASGASEIAWGVGGTGSFRAAGQTTAFRFRADGTVVSAPVVARTNAVISYANVASPAPPVMGCPSRAADYLAPDTTRDGGALCATDEECITQTCNFRYDADGGFVRGSGRCSGAMDGGVPLTCNADVECSEVCAAGRCVPYARPDVQLLANCELRDFVMAPVGSLGAFAVGVTTQGCAAGVLRAGWFDENDGSFSVYGPEARSNIWLGVDVTEFPALGDGGTRRIACSGASRGEPGASRPAVAAFADDRGAQALVAYLGAPVSRPGTAPRERCESGMTSVPVELLGLYRESRMATLRDWVTGSNDGQPETLGETNGVGAPAVLALGEEGWLVGYPEAAASGGTPIALHFVPRMSPLEPPFSERIADGGVAPAHIPRSTAPLMPVAPFLTVPAGGRADHVAIAFGAERGGIQDVGVTWMEDCSANDPVSGSISQTETVWFSLVRFDPSMPGGATATEPVQLSTPTTPGGQPTVAYAGPGVTFVSANWARGDGAPVADDRRGGFVVAWAGAADEEQRDALYAVRISESDGLAVDTSPLVLPVVTAEGVIVPAGTVSLYETYESDVGRVSFGTIDGRDAFVQGRFVCPPAL
jgi:hypothetical protein